MLDRMIEERVHSSPSLPFLSMSPKKKPGPEKDLDTPAQGTDAVSAEGDRIVGLCNFLKRGLADVVDGLGILLSGDCRLLRGVKREDVDALREEMIATLQKWSARVQVLRGNPKVPGADRPARAMETEE
jgi:hypothetical protein